MSITDKERDSNARIIVLAHALAKREKHDDGDFDKMIQSILYLIGRYYTAQTADEWDSCADEAQRKVGILQEAHHIAIAGDVHESESEIFSVCSMILEQLARKDTSTKPFLPERFEALESWRHKELFKNLLINTKMEFLGIPIETAISILNASYGDIPNIMDGNKAFSRLERLGILKVESLGVVLLSQFALNYLYGKWYAEEEEEK